jgi:hypothetical protein
MKLSKKAIKFLKNDRMLMLKVALALDFSEQWILVLIKRNGNNGPLTTIKAVQTIQEETGLNQAEILEDESVGAIR